MPDSDSPPAARRSRREKRKQETRAELVAAAAKVFAHRGFHGTSIEQIADEAGYSTGAVYWHFKGKDDVFLAVYEAQAAARVRDIENFHKPAKGDLPRRARAYADQFMARLNDDPEFMVLTIEFLIHAWRNPPLREAFAHRVAWGRLAAARLLEEERQRTGYQLPMPAQDLATVLRELGVGLGLAKLADPDAIPDRLFGDFIETLFQLMGKTQPDPDDAVLEQPL
jgi:AcrR family transcriptional regulator